MRKILSLVMVLSFLFTMSVYGVSEWAKIQPAGSASPSDIDDLVLVNNEALDRLSSSSQDNCRIAYSSATTLTVAIGQITCSNSAGAIRHMRSNTSAVSVTFSNIDTGSEGAGTYYVWAVADADSANFTIMVSLSSTAPTGATYIHRLGSFVNDSSLDIEESSITNDGDFFSLSLGSWETKSDATVYRAPADGMVSAFDTSNGQCKIFTDGSNPPTTERARGAHGATCLVKKGNYYQTTGATDVYWIEKTK